MLTNNTSNKLMTNSKSKRDAQAKSNSLKPKQGAKRRARRKASPPLVPEPAKLIDLRELVNLLPSKLYDLFRQDIAYWGVGESGADLYGRLLGLLSGLPIELRAFVLRDGQGAAIDLIPVQSDEWIEIERNFAVLHVSQMELESIVQETNARIRRAMELESQASARSFDAFYSETIKIAGSEYFVWSSSELISRARNRLIFLFAARETLSALCRPDAWQEMLRLNYSPLLLVGAQARIAIRRPGSDKSKIVVYPPVLYERLDGIEEPWRIRECPACARIFWAGRKDKFYCSDCQGAHRSKKYRANYPKKYARQRSKQRQMKAAAAAKEKPRPRKSKKSG